MDLNEVESGIIRDFGYQYANVGLEFLAGSWFAGRIGAYRNLSFDKAETIYTAGLGFAVKRFSIDLAVGAAANQAEITTGADSQSVPKGFAASVQFNWRPKREHRPL